MSCSEYELLMADVLGGEASADDRGRFEAHCATCEPCRVEYESARRTLDAMRSLRAPEVVVPFDVSGFSQAARIAPRRANRKFGPLLRIAAVIAISFAAGYLYHAAWAGRVVVLDQPSPEPAPRHIAPSSAPPLNFETALARAHSRNPSRSELGKAMSAVLRP